MFWAAMLVIAGPAAADDAMRCSREAGDVAIAACTRAINSGAGRSSIKSINYRNRGNAYHDKGDSDRAIADYTEAIRLDPKHVNAYNGRGNIYRDKGDIDRALAEYAKAIQLDPNNAHAYANRGLAYEKLADFTRARSDFNTALGVFTEGAIGTGENTPVSDVNGFTRCDGDTP